MSDTTKIPFSFCRIKRAAEFMGIYTEDLLSLAVSDKITLCVMLDGMNSILYLNGIANELNDWYSSLSGNRSAMDFVKNVSKYSSFFINNLASGEDNDLISYPRFYQTKIIGNNNKMNISQSHKGRAFGLWVPETTVINEILNDGKSDFSCDTLGLYRTDESNPILCLITLSSNNYDVCDNEEDDENYEKQYPDIEITENDLWITSEQVKELLNYNGDYSDLPSIARCGVSTNPDFPQEIKKINHIAEHHATNREKLFKSAIFLLSKYPDECRGERKEISPEKWRDCILAHKDEIPPLAITNEDVIIKHLRSAANGKV